MSPPGHDTDRTLILLSNREPYEHVREDEETQARKPPGGLVSALDPTMRRTRGVWVAWGSGSADRNVADGDDHVAVPPDSGEYTLRRVWLIGDDVLHYYQGFCNSVLWPLCHGLTQHVRFTEEGWQRYAEVNARFARAVLDEAQRATRPPVVWVQDYHFALVPQILRAADPSIFVHQFWHIPFPKPEVLGVLPASVREQLLRGLLGNDLLEFQTARYRQNFLECVRDMITDADILDDRVTVSTGRPVEVGVFPISIDVAAHEAMASTRDAEQRVATLRQRYASDDREIGVCVDRIDYTKGIPERLRALDLLWTKWPECRGRFTFIIVATPSRTELEVYCDLEREVVATVGRINARHAHTGWTPIVLVNENVDADLLAVVYRAADLCIVSSLQDGMNLVAKEFIACQVDERGVLVLSRFAGAAEEFGEAVLIDPRNTEEFAEGIRSGFSMPAVERRQRMHVMRDQLRNASIFHWLDDITVAVERGHSLPDRRVHDGEVMPGSRNASAAKPHPERKRGDRSRSPVPPSAPP